MMRGNSKVANNTLKALTKLQQHKSAVIEDSIGNIVMKSTAVLKRWTAMACTATNSIQMLDQWTQSLVIPLPKKGNFKQCQNYLTISLTSHLSKIMLGLTLSRIKAKAEELLAEEHASFRPGRSTVEQIFNNPVIIDQLLVLCSKQEMRRSFLKHLVSVALILSSESASRIHVLQRCLLKTDAKKEKS